MLFKFVGGHFKYAQPTFNLFPPKLLKKVHPTRLGFEKSGHGELPVNTTKNSKGEIVLDLLHAHRVSPKSQTA